MFYESPSIPEMLMEQEKEVKKTQQNSSNWDTGLPSALNERIILERQRKSPVFQKIAEEKLVKKTKREINGPSE